MRVNYTQIHDATVQILLRALETKHLLVPPISSKSKCHTETAKHLGEAYITLYSTLRQFHEQQGGSPNPNDKQRAEIW